MDDQNAENNLKKKEDIYITIKNKDNIYLIFRKLSTEINSDDLKNLSQIDKGNKILTLIFDINSLSQKFNDDNSGSIIFKLIEDKNGNKDFRKIDNIIIKNCFIKLSSSFIFEDEENLQLNCLYISDEIYSMTPNLNKIFKKFNPKRLILKKIKINSKLQLTNFLEFILDIKCEELLLEDIFIELIIKKNEKDDTYNDLNQYFYYEEGKINIKFRENKFVETNIKKLELIDCPLFGLINEEKFENTNFYKDITIDIDENSLLNQSLIITRFKIDKGNIDICFDLDSYKQNDNYINDYIKNLEYLFDLIIDSQNNDYHKLIFKNFDTTKYEYITGENLTFIDENNWILNDKEKDRKKLFEEFDEKINKKIEDNKDILSKVKELVFDNCSNHFIQLILKLINYSKNNLDLLKLKKCGKEHFELKSILNLKINKLILFDIPLIIDKFPEDKDITGEVEYLTIKINILEHYCIQNNLNYYNTLEIIIDLIKNKKYNNNICFEMNALPSIMTYLAAKEYYKIKKIKGKFNIPNYFEFKSISEREKLIEKDINTSPFIIEGFADKVKTITLKNNLIKNKSENYDIYQSYKVEKNIRPKYEYGRESFDIVIDYQTFINVNKIKTIILEDCIIKNFFHDKIKKDNETLINLISFDDKKKYDKKNYKIDIKTLNESIFNNFPVFNDFFDFFVQLTKLDINSTDVIEEQFKNLNSLKFFYNHLKKIFEDLNKYFNEITIIFYELKERKEFYLLFKFYEENKDEKNYDKYRIPNKTEGSFLSTTKLKKLKKFFSNHCIKEENEEKKEIPFSLNDYYISEDEIRIFGEPGKEKTEVELGKFKFKIEYKNNKKKGNNDEKVD